jgi:hypothetical protein
MPWKSFAMRFRSDVMDSAQLPDDLVELERRLAERSRQEPSANLRQRVAAAVEVELRTVATIVPPWRRRRWQLAFAGGLAAAIIVAAFLVRNRNGQAPTFVPGADDTATAPQIAEPSDALLTWGAGRALVNSPELDALPRYRSNTEGGRLTTLRAFTRFDSEFSTKNGEM